MPTIPYSLKSDYAADTPVSASDLNRRALVLASQLPGALRGSALCAGVLPLWNPSDELPVADLVADLVESANASLRVSISGSLFVVSAGAAFIPLSASSATSPLVYTQTQEISRPVQTAEDGTTLYIHLALSIPTITETSPVGVADSQLGAAPQLLLTEIEQEPGALLLASYTDAGGLKDRRTFVTPVLLAREMEALSKRLDALNAPVTSGGNGGGLTLAQFLALQTRVESLEGALADIRAQIARLSAGANPFPAPFDILADEIALTRAGLAELSPPSIERGQISVIGAGFGHAQNSTPDYTPDTHDPLELPFDPLQGLFSP